MAGATLDGGGGPQPFGRYRLIRHLAKGGMAEIWLAEEPLDRGGVRDVVIKRIHPHLVANQEFVMMFLNEARIAARLDHPGCVEIYELGQEGDSYYLAMEYIHGEDIRSIARQGRQKQTALPRRYALEIIASACDGLHYAHEVCDADGVPLNVVHRDVSPQNLLLTYGGRVKLVDFGIAKAADQANHTRPGVLKGKFNYMSPEQVGGLALDRRSDVFALGVLLYEMTTGRRPFKGENELDTMRRIVAAQPQRPREIIPSYPPELEAIVLRALSRDRDARQPTAIAVQEELRAYLAGRDASVSHHELAGYMTALFSERLDAERSARAVGDQDAALYARFGEVKNTEVRRQQELEIQVERSETLETAIRTAAGAADGEVAAPRFDGRTTEGGAVTAPGLDGRSTRADRPTQTGAPPAVAPSPAAVRPRSEPRSGATGRQVLLAGAVAAMAVAALAGWWLASNTSSPATGAPVRARLPPVSVLVETVPPGATVVLNGVTQPFVTPGRLEGLDPSESYQVVLSLGERPPHHVHLRPSRLGPERRVFHDFGRP